MRTWPAFSRDAARLAIVDSGDEQAYWQGAFQQMYEGRIATWDYPWMYACLTQGCRSIRPSTWCATSGRPTARPT